jgi:hypothetical protein
MSPRVALVTCLALPEPDPDETLTVSALRGAGIDASMAAWDDPGVVWSGFDLCVIRSTWNYHRDPERFVLWLDRAWAESFVANPAPVVRWNIHKRYLAELSEAGLPVVPTAFVAPDSTEPLAAILGQRGWADVVIKPCVSAGSARTRRFRDGTAPEAETFLRSITATGDAMVQPFVPSVEDGGERSIVWIGGEVTHAVVKRPRFDADDEQVSEAQPVTNAERELVQDCLDVAGDGLLYARLDLMRGDDGEPLISELELIEPSLFLLQSERAARAFVEAVRALLP